MSRDCAREICARDREIARASRAQHSNGALLSDYGFALATNPLDCATLQWGAIAAGVRAAIGPRYARARERALAATGCWGRLLGRGYVFDRSAEPPAELILATWLLCAAGGGWMFDGGAEADIAARDFLQLPLTAQLDPNLDLHGARSPRVALALMSAIHAQRCSYSAVAAAPCARAAPVTGGRGVPAGVSVSRLADASRVVRGHLQIWDGAEARVRAAAALPSALHQDRDSRRRNREPREVPCQECESRTTRRRSR